MRVRVTFTSDNPDTIQNRLAHKLGRAPTKDEQVSCVKHILFKGGTVDSYVASMAEK